MKNLKDYRFIYNPKQAEFYIQNGLIPVKIDNHKVTHNLFFQFKDSEELQKVFHAWVDRKFKNVA